MRQLRSPHEKPSAHTHIEAETGEREHPGHVESLVSGPEAVVLAALFLML